MGKPSSREYAELKQSAAANISAICTSARKSAGWTQRQVAAELGVSQSTITAFECGQLDGMALLWGYAMLFGDSVMRMGGGVRG